MKRTALSLLCVLALCAGLLSGRAAAAGTIYFTAVNDTILPLSAGSMPMVSDGVLYVPYTMFDPNSTGISLGVSCSYSHSGNTLTVYNLRQMLVYDLDAGNARNQHTGYVYSTRAVTRNGVVYIPVGFTCDFFGLSWSNTITAYGNLIRVTNSSAVLSDADFIDAGSPWMASRLQEYLQSQNIPDPEPQPSTDPQPTPSDPEPEEPVTGGRIYLAFRCETGESWAQLLDLLDQYGIHALFLLPADLMAEQDSLIRRTVGSGHSVGLLVRGEDPVDAAAQLEEGSRLLAKIARVQTHIAAAEDSLTALAEGEGFLLWQGEVDAVPDGDISSATLAANTLRSITRRSGNIFVTMDDSAVSAQALTTLLRQLQGEDYTFRAAVETDL